MKIHFLFRFTLLCALSVLSHRGEAATLLGQYTFENDSGSSIYNSATSTYTATNGSSASADSADSTLVDLATNNYRTFDGGDFINTPDVLSGSGSFSLVVWFQTGTATRMDLLAAGGSYVLSLNDPDGGNGMVTTGGVKGAGQVRFSQKTDGTWDKAIYSNSISLTDGTWHLAAVTYDGTNILMYIDGVLQTATSTGSGVLPTGTNELIGSQNTSPTYTYNWRGAIDDVRYYSGALTGTEMQTIYDSTKSLYAVPEPYTLALAGAALGLMLVRFRRRS